MPNISQCKPVNLLSKAAIFIQQSVKALPCFSKKYQKIKGYKDLYKYWFCCKPWFKIAAGRLSSVCYPVVFLRVDKEYGNDSATWLGSSWQESSRFWHLLQVFRTRLTCLSTWCIVEIPLGQVSKNESVVIEYVKWRTLHLSRAVRSLVEELYEGSLCFT